MTNVWVYRDDTAHPIEDAVLFVAADGTQYPGGFPKSEIDGMQPVTDIESGSGSVITYGTPTLNGDHYERTVTRSNPPAAVPEIVTALQARLALNQSGLRSTIETWVNGQNQEIQDYWHYSSTVHRNHAIITGAMSELGITSEQMDGLFILAGSL